MSRCYTHESIDGVVKRRAFPVAVIAEMTYNLMGFVLTNPGSLILAISVKLEF
ncbi:hypothetical protein MH215_13265 [Paenibacillus sp. ACRSA]|uniref:hypothetical protein n=1 Tax=Paenibacillus sp. ACRSA TaxID=2918211 RepID=UPI001EF4F214|nr:hypothetical protein [Paenibacillus sp. ACRSA]MCG7377967.1 hypothetical protein [Paenibacillus sp. ACRSA]